MISELNATEVIKDELCTDLLHAYTALEYLSEHDCGVLPEYFEKLGSLIKDIVPKERNFVHYFTCSNGELIEK